MSAVRVLRMVPQPSFDGTFWRLPVDGRWGVDAVRWEHEHQATNRLVRLYQADPPGPGPCVRVVQRRGVWWWVYRVEVSK